MLQDAICQLLISFGSYVILLPDVYQCPMIVPLAVAYHSKTILLARFPAGMIQRRLMRRKIFKTTVDANQHSFCILNRPSYPRVCLGREAPVWQLHPPNTLCNRTSFMLEGNHLDSCYPFESYGQQAQEWTFHVYYITRPHHSAISLQIRRSFSLHDFK